jgi:hypothetical protein
MDWMIENWWLVWGVMGLIVIAIASLHFRREPETRAGRMFFWFFPL